MAKKYLLYIHDERFENESHKSALINDLLAEHYKDSSAERVIIKEPEEVIEKVAKTKSDWRPCKHGTDPKFCKFAKPGKPCK